MPEQQSFVLYIVVGSGSKSGSRLQKTAPGAVFKVRLHGSLATGQKMAPGFPLSSYCSLTDSLSSYCSLTDVTFFLFTILCSKSLGMSKVNINQGHGKHFRNS